MKILELKAAYTSELFGRLTGEKYNPFILENVADELDYVRKLAHNLRLCEALEAGILNRREHDKPPFPPFVIEAIEKAASDSAYNEDENTDEICYINMQTYWKTASDCTLFYERIQ